ncbi:hypothetical protein BHE74_00036628 [Ensete ventricosum]|nr:hypothetical protein BHE74_00036628 [Ensete ventricosum]
MAVAPLLGRYPPWIFLGTKEKKKVSFGVILIRVSVNSASQRKDSWRAVVTLAYQSLGVVYGDLSTSPLYVYKNTFAEDIEHSETNEEIYGVLSFVFWTLTLVPLLKYVLIVLRADDNGEGGTFALYSLLCRHARVGFLPNGQLADEELSTYKKVAGGGAALPSASVTNASTVKRLLEKHRVLQRLLLILALIGTCMVIGDGVLTPAISVFSAVSGLELSMSKEQHKDTKRLGNASGTGELKIKVLVFLCIKSVPVPYVRPEERFLVGRIGPKEYRVYRCIARYGYHDIHKDDLEFEKDLVCSIAEFIRSGVSRTSGIVEQSEKDDDRMAVVAAGIRMSEEDADEIGPLGGREIQSPVTRRKKTVRFVLPESPPHMDATAREELQELMDAREAGMAFILGHADVRAKSGSGLIKRFVIDVGYNFLRRNCRNPAYAVSIPHASTLEVGTVYDV